MPWITTVILVAVSVALYARGRDYYLQDLGDRAAHPDYRLLNPAGFIGHGYGIVGTMLIFTNLLYLVRRRFANIAPAWMGSMKTWLHVHVFTGFLGSLLVVFHSAFQLRTAIATVTSLSLAIVVVTGIVGLYLYNLLPKAGLKPLQERLDELERLLPGVVREIEEFLRRSPATRLPANASLVRTLWTVPRWIREARARRRGLVVVARRDKLLRALERTDPKVARALMKVLGELAAGEIDTHAGGAVMRSWRSLHRFLALLMLTSVSVHIAVAWYYGFRWIFQ